MRRCQLNILSENITLLLFTDWTSRRKLKYTAVLIYKAWHSIPLLLGKEVQWEGQEAYTGALPFTRQHSKHFFTILLVLALPSVSLCIRFPLICSLLRKRDSDKGLLKSSFSTGQSQQPVAKVERKPILLYLLFWASEEVYVSTKMSRNILDVFIIWFKNLDEALEHWPYFCVD